MEVSGHRGIPYAWEVVAVKLGCPGVLGHPGCPDAPMSAYVYKGHSGTVRDSWTSRTQGHECLCVPGHSGH